MHETLNDMIERALNEQFDIVESENLDLQQKFSALQALKPPTSIAADWALGIEGASEKLGALRQAAYDHRSSKIAVDEFLNHFAPLRIELVALDDLIGAL